MSKKLKIKLPKRIGGIKVPKQVRKGPVAEFINSGAGQVLLGEALLFVAGSFTAKKADGDSPVAGLLREPMETVKSVARSASQAGTGSRRAAGRSSEKLQYAFSEAARAFRAAMESEPDHRRSEMSAAANEDVAPSDVAKKKGPRGALQDTSSTPH